MERTCDGSPGAIQNALGAGPRLGRGRSARPHERGSTAWARLARYLGALPGRKHVIFYSAGYPMQPQALAADVIGGLCAAGGAARGALDQARVDATGMLRALVDAANRAQVSVYTVDARGLMGDALPARARAPTRLMAGGAAETVMRRNSGRRRRSCPRSPTAPAPRASLNTNELARGMRAAARDARGYYLLAYAPPAWPQGRTLLPDRGED